MKGSLMTNPFEEYIKEHYTKYRCPTHGEITGNQVFTLYEDDEEKLPRCSQCYFEYIFLQLPELTVIE